jgi:hypothetical protein
VTNHPTEPRPAQTRPDSVFRKALEWIRDDAAQFGGGYAAKLAADALRQAPEESPPLLDRNTALLLHDDLATPAGLRRFYAFHMAAYNDAPLREHLEGDCTLLAADVGLQLAFLFRTPEGSYFEQRATCQASDGRGRVYVDFIPIPPHQVRAEFGMWALKVAPLEAAAPASSPEGGAA